MKRVKIAGKLIGEGKPCFIIAEAGVNHNGDVSLAKNLIEVAKEAGADAVKFQTFRTGEVVTKNAAKAEYQKETTGVEESQFEMLKASELTESDFKELFTYAQEKGIILISSPFDRDSIDLLDILGVPAYKIASGEITNFPLLKHAAGKGKPIILSTGMSVTEEIGEALKVIKKTGVESIILLHCVTNYPAKIEDMNLKVMETLESTFKLPVGLSDHTPGITIPIAAAALGACVIEKHFTMDKKLHGPDHRASLEPGELGQMVRAIRDVEKALGDGVKRLTAEEEEIKKVARRSIVAKVDIPEGAIIVEAMLDVRRPGTGIEPKYMEKVCGAKAKNYIKKEESISWAEIGLSIE